MSTHPVWTTSVEIAAAALRRVTTDGECAFRADRAADLLRIRSNRGVVGGSSVGTAGWYFPEVQITLGKP
jgi:hypothetical protein